MPQNVQISVRSELEKVIADLKKISDAASDTNKELGEMGKTVGDGIETQQKKTLTYVQKTASLMRGVLNNLKSDIKSMVALESISAGLKLSSQFKDSIKQTIGLGDAIRKMGSTFGIASRDFAAFQGKMMRGLGDVGLSSEAATKSLEGLAETPVRGQENLVEYAKTAGMLASAFGQRGAEGEIAKSLAGVIQARGGDVNDLKQMGSLAEDIRRVSVATGAKPTETLQAMTQMFSDMPEDMLKKMGTRQMAVMAAGAHVAGPGATKFIQDFMVKDPLQRMFADITGQTKLFTEKGFNVDAIRKFAEHARSVGGPGGIEAGLKFMGIEEGAAKGFVRLYKNLEQVNKAQEEVSKMSGNLETTYKQNMTAAEAFQASLNRLKGFLGKPIGFIQEKLTGALGGASQSTAGSAAVVAGGGILAAVLAGGGLNQILRRIPGGGLLGKVAGAEAAKLSGAQPVYVVNASEIGQSLTGMVGGAGSVLGRVGAAGVAGVAGFELGEKVINPLLEEKTQGTTEEGFTGNVVERLFFKLDKLIGGESSTAFMRNQKMQLDIHVKEGKLAPGKPTSRGPGY